MTSSRRRVDLPDGWYEIPGDECGDGKRISKYGNTSERYFYYCYVRDKEIYGLIGLDQSNQEYLNLALPLHQKDFDTAEVGSFHVHTAESVWNCKIESLLAEHINRHDSKPKFGAALALAAIAGAIFGIRKHNEVDSKIKVNELQTVQK